MKEIQQGGTAKVSFRYLLHRMCAYMLKPAAERCSEELREAVAKGEGAAMGGKAPEKQSCAGLPSVPAISQIPPEIDAELTILRSVIASLPDLIYVKDAQSRFLLANEGTSEAMGAASSAEMIGKTDFDFYPEGLARGFFEDEQRVIQSGKPLVSREEHIRTADGKPRHILTTKVPLRDHEGRVVGIIGIGRNITALKEVEAELERAREDLRFKATHDSLTCLYNREAILDALSRELMRARREHGCVALLLGDVDHFKRINDTHGHLIGDQVLRETARRLMQSVRPYDLVGRYGGEEFLVVLTNCPAPDAQVRANQIREAIASSPIDTLCGPVPISMSLGVLTTNEWGILPSEDLLREVDVGLYQAKAAGRNQSRLVRPEERRVSAASQLPF